MTSATLFLTAAGILLVALFGCLAASLRGSLLARVVALQLAGAVTTLLLVVLAVAFHRSSYLVAPLALACTAAPGTLVFVNVLERWLENDV